MVNSRWQVVGGGDKGGILVRGGQSTTSEQLSERLATGAMVEEVELIGDRLRYKKVSGDGPETGWVSTSLKDKALLTRATDDDQQQDSTPQQGDGAGAADESTVEWSVREGDYYVTLGTIFKKSGSDPGAAVKMIKLNRKVGSIVHTTGKVWQGPKGGYWVELDTSRGDSGAGEKPGYVMIDGSGMGTPGPCLQKALLNEGPPLILRAATPPGAKPWDGGSDSQKEFVVLQGTSIEEVRAVIGILFGASKEAVVMGANLTDTMTVGRAGFKTGDSVSFEMKTSSALSLRIMSPVEAGAKLCELAIKEDWTVKQVKTLLCSTTGLKPGSTLMARGKMGQRVSEDAKLDEGKKVVDCGYKDGDEIAFIYLGDLEGDLQKFLAKN